MRSTPMIFLRRGAFATVLLMTAVASHANGRWSVDLSVGLPIGPVGGYGYGPGYYGGQVYGVPAYGTVYGALPTGAVSISVGGGRYWRHGGTYYRPWGPRWVVVAPPVVLGAVVPLAVDTPEAPPPPAWPSAPRRPDPVIYPRSGQSAVQTEADRQECNRWATTQPAALADAEVFQRSVEACMDGRGYSMK